MEIEKHILKKLEKLNSQSDTKPHGGAVIVRDGEIICSGFACKAAPESKMAEKNPLVIHAEEAALMQALQEGIDISGADIYVLLIRNNGEIRYTDWSYCCCVCSRYLTQTGIKNVIYPVPEGWNKVTVKEMFQQAIKRAEEKFK